MKREKRYYELKIENKNGDEKTLYICVKENKEIYLTRNKNNSGILPMEITELTNREYVEKINSFGGSSPAILGLESRIDKLKE